MTRLIFSVFFFAFILLRSYGQEDSLSGKREPKIADSLKYPYIGYYTPSFVATYVGYNFVQSQELEVGILANIGDARGFKTGAFFGPAFLYRRSIDRNLNAISTSLGLYSGFSFGCEVNYNWNTQYSIWGVKPFVGISIKMFQIMYGYNVLNHNRNKDLGLRNHSLSFKIVIPFCAQKNDFDKYG